LLQKNPDGLPFWRQSTKVVQEKKANKQM